MHLPPETILASGPVILENNQVLLCREIKKGGVASPLFMFPGGGVEEFDATLEDTCRREAKEELGIEITILRPLRTLFVQRPDKTGYAILVHFLSKRTSEIVPGKNIVEWGWFDQENLPDNCTPNVREIIQSYLNEPRL